MTKTLGGILGTLMMLLVASLILLTSQGESCSADWWSCAPGDSPEQTAQLIGIAVLLLGPYVGYRVGAAVGPRVTRRIAVGILAGTLPGWLTLTLGWWFPYSAAVMIAGAGLGGVVTARRSRSDRQPTTA